MKLILSLLVLITFSSVKTFAQESKPVVMLMEMLEDGDKTLTEEQKAIINLSISQSFNSINTKINDCAKVITSSERNSYANSKGFYSIDWSTFSVSSCNMILPKMGVTAYLHFEYTAESESISFFLKDFKTNGTKIFFGDIDLNKANKTELDEFFSYKLKETVDYIIGNLCSIPKQELNTQLTSKFLGLREFDNAQEQIKSDILSYLHGNYYRQNTSAHVCFTYLASSPNSLTSCLFNEAFSIFPNASTAQKIAFVEDLSFMNYLYTLVSIYTNNLDAAKKSNDDLSLMLRGSDLYESDYHLFDLILNTLMNPEYTTGEAKETVKKGRESGKLKLNGENTFDESYKTLIQKILSESKEKEIYAEKLEKLNDNLLVWKKE